MKVLVSDNISLKGIELMKKAGLDVDLRTGMSPEELKSCIGDYHGLIIRSATKVTADVIDAAINLRVIGRAGSGLDNVDREAATKKGIVVMNTPGGNTITAAEHAIAMMFATARNIPQATQSMKEGRWEKKKFMGVELFNKTLGILGLGNIGAQVAKRAQGLWMNVICSDPFLSDEKAGELAVEKVTIEDLFKRSDFITVHTPLTPETKNLIRKETIQIMKNGVRIINCARGGIINERDLHDAILSGKVAGAALDVYEKEPPADLSLIKLDRVVCTPHLGASTAEAQENVATAVAEQIIDYLIGGVIRNAVNFPSIPAERLPLLMPYIKLAELLGSFTAQVYEGGISEITLEFRGEAEDIDTKPVTIAAVKGLLTPILLETVNFVNAPLIAQERGIEVKVTKTPDSMDYHNMLVMKVRANGKESAIYGTLYGKKDPRIIRVDNFPVEIIPEGTMLFIYNNDQPGVIGNIGTILGRNNINIARMHFGRESSGGMAISVVNVDSDITDETLNEIGGLPNILSVKVIKL